MKEKERCLCIEPDNQVIDGEYIIVTKSTTLHRTLHGDNNYQVVVKTTIDLESCLPIPIIDKIVYIQNIINTIFPWPKHLVFLSTTKVKILLV